ncbi:hypothetical protein AB0L97_32770 [Nocardia sp. NPDC051911]|uniref:hypothetical protein n=1 Tax=Nocardia sp. NPDC051911 TaxID=3154648 RepID=UPI00343742F8
MTTLSTTPTMPVTPAITGESWEVVETARSQAAAEIDLLVATITRCRDCGHSVDGLEHYDAAHAVIWAGYMPDPTVLPPLLAEALTRLAAAGTEGGR